MYIGRRFMGLIRRIGRWFSLSRIWLGKYNIWKMERRWSMSNRNGGRISIGSMRPRESMTVYKWSPWMAFSHGRILAAAEYRQAVHWLCAYRDNDCGDDSKVREALRMWCRVWMAIRFMNRVLYDDTSVTKNLNLLLNARGFVLKGH